jgi:hypothetical protein
MKTATLVTLASLIILSSCKKDPVKEAPAPSMKGKWNLESTIIKSYENSTLVTSITEPGNGAIFDFQNNGSVVMSHDGVIESHPYTITSDSKLNIEGYIYEIRHLNRYQCNTFPDGRIFSRQLCGN